MCHPSPFTHTQAYWDSRTLPYRAEVAEACAALAPFTSICDVGAGPGVTIPALRARWPDAALTVIEPVAEYGDFGRMYFDGAVAWHQTCGCQGIPALPADVYVFSHALGGMGPDDWARVLTLAVQHARRGVVWLESWPPLRERPYLHHPLREWVACAEAAGGQMLSCTASAASPDWQLAVCVAPMLAAMEGARAA